MWVGTNNDEVAVYTLVHEPFEVYLKLLRKKKGQKIMLRTDKTPASFMLDCI